MVSYRTQSYKHLQADKCVGVHLLSPLHPASLLSALPHPLAPVSDSFFQSSDNFSWECILHNFAVFPDTVLFLTAWWDLSQGEWDLNKRDIHGGYDSGGWVQAATAFETKEWLKLS